MRITSNVEHGVSIKGTLQGWIKNIGMLCRGNSRLIAAVSLSLSGSLLEPLAQEAGGVNFKDASSIGKTTLARVGASVHGSPKYLKPWRSTANALEGTASTYNDLPLILDEAAQADPKEINAVCYLIGNGQQKSRANKFGQGRPTRNFRVALISTSEKAFSTYAAAAGVKSSAGAEVRIVEVPADTGKYGVFENLHGFKDGASFADNLKEQCTKNYGVMGREFIKHVCQVRGKIPDKFLKFRAQFLDEHLPPNAAPQVKRVCTKFASIAFAGELATAWDLTGWEVGEATEAAGNLFKAWLDSRGGPGQKERQEVIERMRLFFEQNGNSRFEPWEDRTKLVLNRAEFKGNDNNSFYVVPNVLKQEILNGHDFARAKEYLHEEGLLEEKTARPIRPPHSETVRCYCFKNVFAG